MREGEDVEREDLALQVYYRQIIYDKERSLKS